MSNASFHWRKFEAAHWVLSKITTNQRIFYSSQWIITNEIWEGPKDTFRYDYKSFSIEEIKALNKDFSNEELNEAIGTLDVNKHISIYPNEQNESDFSIVMTDEGRKAYESLYYLALRDQQKETSISLLNAENNLLDFVKAEWYRHKGYIIAILLLIATIAGIILQLKCNK